MARAVAEELSYTYATYFSITESNPALAQAMEIAMGFLQGSGLSEEFVNPENLAAAAIRDAWQSGVRHPIALANAAIVCAEQTAKLGQIPSVFARLI
jgi:hypothetical protein